MNFQRCRDEYLIEIYRQGDEAAIEELFERYKALVRKKAKAMFLAGGDNDDLIQEGMIGLYKAVRDYDGTKEASFSTFAGICIDRQIMTAVAASNRKKNIPLNTYISFDLPANSDDGSDVKLLDVMQPNTEQNPENMYIDKEHAKQMEADLRNELSPLEKQVFALHMESKNYRQIAVLLNKSPKSIDNALQRIRKKAMLLSFAQAQLHLRRSRNFIGRKPTSFAEGNFIAKHFICTKATSFTA